MFQCNVLILARMPEVAGRRTNEFPVTFFSFGTFFPLQMQFCGIYVPLQHSTTET